MNRPKTYVLRWLDAVVAAEVSRSAKAAALVMATHADYATGANMRAATATIALTRNAVASAWIRNRLNAPITPANPAKPTASSA